MPPGDFDLELSIFRRQGAEYGLSARLLRPDANEEFRTVDVSPFQLDADALRRAAQDPAAYAKALSSLLFSATGPRDAFVKARAAARDQQVPLRVRLSIGQDAGALQDVRWELLPDPEDGESLLLQPDVMFSRFLASQDWRPLPTRPRGTLRALVVVANPKDLSAYAPGGRGLAPIRVAEEVARAREALAHPGTGPFGGFQVEVLSEPGTATLDHLGDRLREGFDVLYLVCHGALVEGVPRLWLEDAAGNSDRIEGRALVERVQDPARRPRLVLLASCESAGTGALADGEALGALGPRLARSGVPAVLAMNGKMSMKSAAMFIPAFFHELAEDGRVDRAVAVARGRLAGQPDWWMPALFMRLRNGRLWYEQGFSGDRPGFDRWDSVVRDLRERMCVPILGPSLDEPILGSLRDVARLWADQYGYPLAPHGREDLAQVAQYLSYRQDLGFPQAQLAEVLKRHVRDSHRAVLPAPLLEARLEDVTLDALVSAAGAAIRKGPSGEEDAHARLARLPIALYVTARRDNLLRDALVEAGKQPRVAVVRWKDSRNWPPGVPDASALADPGASAGTGGPAPADPPERRPVVLHLFGNLQWPETLVLAEDDYFDYLVELARVQQRVALASPPPGSPAPPGQQAAVPEWIAARLSASGLLFLGFDLDDWELRIGYRALLLHEGSLLGRRRMRLAVQINPGDALEPFGARKYLETYFEKGRSLGMYWGPAEAFLSELATRWGRP